MTMTTEVLNLRDYRPKDNDPSQDKSFDTRFAAIALSRDPSALSKMVDILLKSQRS